MSLMISSRKKWTTKTHCNSTIAAANNLYLKQSGKWKSCDGHTRFLIYILLKILYRLWKELWSILISELRIPTAGAKYALEKSDLPSVTPSLQLLEARPKGNLGGTKSPKAVSPRPFQHSLALGGGGVI